MNGTISLQSKLKGAVSMANTIINGGASPYPKTVGPSAIASFSDGAQDAPLKSLVFDIEPVQDLHGYDYPWSAGGGVNQLPSPTATSKTVNGITIAVNNGVYSISGTATAQAEIIFDLPSDVTYDNTYKCAFLNTAANSGVTVYWRYNSTNGTSYGFGGGANRVAEYSGGGTFNKVRFIISNGTAISGTLTTSPVLCLKSVTTPTSFIPYSNICPISGWTQVNVWVKPTYDTTLTPTATIPLGQTVYSGTLDVVRGKLNAKPYYASYSGQTLVGPWISSHDKYVAGATPTTGAQVVDMGAAGTDYDVTPQTIKTLLGVNNIWADSGDTTLEYYPAAASIVSVLNRSSKVYTSIPLGKIRYETYQITPQQTIDLDSYRSENGNLLRNPVATKCKIEFNTPLMTDSEWADVWKIIKAGFNNSTERKLKLRYYDTLSATYKTGYFYVPDVQTTIRNIEEGAGVINYNEIRIAFIEY